MLTPLDIARMIDHSLLQPYLTDRDIIAGCEVALKHGVASVCARPTDIPIVAERLHGSCVAVSTVIGFPHGAHLTEVKEFEAIRAIEMGCSELDMVINIGKLLSGDEEYVEADIRAVTQVAHARGAIVKVIFENCYLSDGQKKVACRLAERAGADFVKTSTGYGTSGATTGDIRLMRAAVSERVRVKGAGGLRTLDAVLAARAAGAVRCGATATEAIMTEAQARCEAGTLEEACTDAAPEAPCGNQY